MDFRLKKFKPFYSLLLGGLLFGAVELEAATLSGTVSDDSTGVGIANASLLFVSGNIVGVDSVFTTTDAQGFYSAQVNNGIYLGDVSALGYQPSFITVQVAGNTTLDIPLTATNNPPPPIDVAWITGTTSYIDPNGVAIPSPGAMIQAMPNNPSTQPMITTVSDANGNYTLGLPFVDTYTVMAMDAITGEMQFWDHVYNVNSATPVQVSQNQTVSGIDFDFGNSITQLGTISGTVTFTDPVTGNSNPLPGIAVEAIPPFPILIPQVTYTDQNGNYSFDVIPSTGYNVAAYLDSTGGTFGVVQFWDHVSDPNLATPIDVVVGQTNSGIDFDFDTFNPPNDVAWISGNVFEINSPIGLPVPVPFAMVTVTNANTVITGITDQMGNYTIGVPQVGSYIVSAEAFTSAGTLETLYWDNVTIANQATPVQTSQNQTTSGIDFYFDSTTNPNDVAWISGTVSLADSTSPGGFVPFQGANVWAMPNSPILPIFSAISDANGNYTIGVPQVGDYTVYAEINIFGNPLPFIQYWDHVTDVNLATPVTVTQGNTTSGIDFDISANPPPPVPGWINGTVTAMAGGGIFPVDGAFVVAEDVNGVAIFSAVSDAQGNYSLPIGTVGNYKVYCSYGFAGVTQWWDHVGTESQATILTINQNTILSNINFDFTNNPPPTGMVISGTVTQISASGIVVPAPNVYVEAFPSTPMGISFNAITDANGDYSITVSFPDVFIVGAFLNGTGTQGAVQYWDHVNDMTQATPIPIAPGQGMSGVNFDFTNNNPPALSSISGTVSMIDSTTASGSIPLSGKMVTAQDDFGWVFTTMSDANGNYTIPIPQSQGSYIVSAELGFGIQVVQYWDHVSDPTQATPVFTSPANPNVTGIDFDFDLSNPPPPTDVAWITGTVSSINALGDTIPVANAYVEAMPNSPILPLVGGVTDANGNYTIGLPSAGSYLVLAYDNSGNIQYWDHVSDPNQATAVNLAPNQTASGINFDFSGSINPPVGNSISGVVNFSNGVAGQVIIDVFQVADSTGNGNTGLIFTIPTSIGPYTIDGLPPGNYVVRATAIVQGSTFIEEIWYDNSATAANADVITLGTVFGYTQLTGIDFTFTGGNVPTGYATMSGTVFNVDSLGLPVAPLSNASIFLLPANGVWIDSIFATTDQNGNYSMQVPKGVSFKVGCFAPGFYPEYYDNKNDFFSADLITISPVMNNLSGIDFTLDALTPNSNAINGTIFDESGNPIPNALVIIISSSELDDPTKLVTAITDQNGVYQVPNLDSDDYIVWSHAGGFVPTFYSNVQNWQNATLVTVNGAVSGIDIDMPTVSNGSFCEVNGNVKADDGTGADNFVNVKDAFVYAVDSNGQVLGFSLTDENGNYGIENIAPGDYTIHASKFKLEEGTVSGINLNGSAALAAPGVDFILNAATSVEEIENEIEIPTAFGLSNNYPNPFNPTTTIEFKVPEVSNVKITVYNVLGQSVKTLVNANFTTGNYKVSWDGTNEVGSQVSSGIYFYRLDAGNFSHTKRMLLLK